MRWDKERYANDPVYRSKLKATTRAWRKANRPKIRAYEAKRRATEPKAAETFRRWWLRTTYGITPAEFDAMVERQDGLCAICERKPRVRLHVDHSHDTRMLRLLLCLTCNAGLGNFGDNPSWLRRAIDYLEIWRIIHARWLAAGRKPIPKKKISKRKKGKKTKCRPTSSLKKNPKPRD